MKNASTINFKKTFLLLISVLLCIQDITAQTSFTDFIKNQSDNSTKTHLTHKLEMDFRPGFIFQTHDFFRGDNYDMKPIRTSLSAILKYGFSQPENSATTAAFGKSTQGIGIAYNSFLEPSAIGSPVSVFAFQSAPVWNISSAVTLDYEWNFGLSFGWNPYDETTNPKNHIIGTKINARRNKSRLEAITEYRIAHRNNFLSLFKRKHRHTELRAQYRSLQSRNGLQIQQK